MGPPASRPPSEQGPEYQTLDALQELARKVDELASKPALVVNAAGNWWDVLPQPQFGLQRPRFNWDEVFVPGRTDVYQLGAGQPSWYPMLRIATHADRLELSLTLQGGAYLIWQRALFFNEGPRG